MANTKMTKKEYFALIRTIVEATDREDKAEMLGFIDHEVELLSKKKSSTKTSSWKKNVSTVTSGRGVPIQFFKKNAWLLIITIISVISLIGMRYSTQSKMQQINELNTELKRAESDKLHHKSLYMSLIRETEMQRLIDEKKLNLYFQEQPPYEIINDITN